MTCHIKQLTSLSQYKAQLTDLLFLCIKSGASLGFKTAVDKPQLTTYWEEINTQLKSRIFLGTLYIIHSSAAFTTLDAKSRMDHTVLK